jgi:hypothetical protein
MKGECRGGVMGASGFCGPCLYLGVVPLLYRNCRGLRLCTVGTVD